MRMKYSVKGVVLCWCLLRAIYAMPLHLPAYNKTAFPQPCRPCCPDIVFMVALRRLAAEPS